VSKYKTCQGIQFQRLLKQNHITFTEKANYYKKIKLPVSITLAVTERNFALSFRYGAFVAIWRSVRQLCLLQGAPKIL